jgi:hypothetical protein
MVDATPYYYTFSTIAQTLAAAIALLAAFALYRLQGLESLLMTTSLRIEEVFTGAEHGKFQALRIAGRWHECRDFMAGEQFRSELEKEPVRSRRDTFRQSLSTSDSVRTRLAISLFLTVAAILLSVAALPLAPALATSAIGPWLLGAAIAGVLACLIAYLALESVSKPRGFSSMRYETSRDGRAVDAHRAAAAQGTEAGEEGWPTARVQSPSTDGYSLRAPDRVTVAAVALGDGLRQRLHLLASVPKLDTARRVETLTRRAAPRVELGRRD